MRRCQLLLAINDIHIIGGSFHFPKLCYPEIGVRFNVLLSNLPEA